jgi:rhamnosyltransferase
MPKVSIIILTKNEEKFIEETLNSIYTQEIDCDFEVIVIDSGSQDKTLEIVQRYPVKLIQIPSKAFGHGKTRNLGISNAQGDYIVFLNGDATPQNKKWLIFLINSLSVNSTAGVYSRIYPRPNCNPLDERDILNDSYLFDGREKYIKSFSEYYKMTPERKRKFIAFHTVSCAIKRDLLLKNMFADIEFGEDLEWSKRMLEKGFKIIYESNSEVIHSHNIHFSFINTIRRYFDDARLNQRLLKRWAFLDLLKLLIIIVVESRKDTAYILRLRINPMSKLNWIIRSPLMRTAEFLGIFLGTLLNISPKFVNRLSLIEEIKRN